MTERNTTVLTLDAGGTNLVFSAFRNFKEIIEPITLPANAHDYDKCIGAIISGFEQVAEKVGTYEVISFAFPGPADYDLGIIGNLPNFNAFRKPVPLGPILKHHFNVPVLINNDGNLFALGVARAGFLPALNQRLRDAGSSKQFQNLVGITLGTGFGCGIVANGELVRGDNSCGAEIHNTLNATNPNWNAEESISTRAIQRVYAEYANIPFDAQLMPRDIYEIATGRGAGNVQAAQESFLQFGKALGASIVNVLTLIDGVVVIGGGLSKNWDVFAPAMFNEVNRQIEDFKGTAHSRLSFKVYNLEDPTVFDEFAKGNPESIVVPRSGETIQYDSMQRTGIALCNIDSSFATSLGAYALALEKLQNNLV
ncbi:MAG: ROK family protein [Cyclobacteriaceae bacterium]|nr:ROK family protein [Cyclobacteriaceae bacterium]